MAARKLPTFGEVLLVEEIAQSEPQSLFGRTVRVTGRLTSHDCDCNRARLSDITDTYSVTMDTTLVEPFEARLGILLQVIGEYGTLGKDADCLRIRVARCVEGLDMTLFERALRAQRQFMGSSVETL